MTPEEVKAICDQRLESWKARLVQGHATPLALLGVGHDWNSGKLVFCTTEDMPGDQLAVFLLSVAKDLLDKK